MPTRWSQIFKPRNRIRRLATLDEAQFLAGRQSRFFEYLRVLRIAREFFRGFRALHHLGPAVTVFGSARFKQDHPFCAQAEAVGSAIAREGYTVITGGGPGLMEAANRGAKIANGYSIGINVVLPHEPEANPYLDQMVMFYYFFVRKVMLVKYSQAFVILPGGVGTLDELSEALTLIQTGKLYDFPVILVGKDFWKPFHQGLLGKMQHHHTIEAAELSHLTITDDPSEVARILREHGKRIGLPLISPQSQL